MTPTRPVRLSFSARLRIWAAPLLLQCRDLFHDFTADIPLLTRFASHAVLLTLTLLTVGASGIQLNLKSEASEVTPVADTGGGVFVIEPQDYLMRAPFPVTNIPKRLRREVVEYAVQPRDTISGIAERFEVSPDTLVWSNPELEKNPDLLSVGQVLEIPPVSGVLVQVTKDDTVAKLAEKYSKASKKTKTELANDIANSEFNKERHALQAPDYVLTLNEFVMIPGGAKQYQPRYVQAYNGPIPTSAIGTGRFGWPVSGAITQRFFPWHPALDIGAPTGTPVYAADSGIVAMSGWSNAGYGNMILISHGNGYMTRYAHLSVLAVNSGQAIKKGQLLGRVGSTGRSTGPHLHFEIIQGNGHRNPYVLLPGR